MLIAEGGASCGLSLLALSRLLRRSHPNVRQVWACHDHLAAPPWATRVKVGSGRHRWLAARSEFWLTDGITMKVIDPETSGIPLARGPHTVVVGVVDPSLERVGSDVVDWPLLPPSSRRLRNPVDVVLAPSSLGAQRTAPAWGFDAQAILAPALAEYVSDRTEARRRLQWAADERVVAWHLSDSRRHAPFPEAELAQRLSGWRITSVADSTDPATLVAAADVVVADTGWPLACAAAAGHAVVVFAPDPRDGRSRGPGLVQAWPDDLPAAGDPETLAVAVEARAGGPLPEDAAALRAIGSVAADGDPRGATSAAWRALTGAGSDG